MRGSFQETAARKTAKNTVKHRSGSVGLMVAIHRDCSESSVVITTLKCVQTNGVAASGTGDGSSGDEHSENTHKKVKVSKMHMEIVVVQLL